MDAAEVAHRVHVDLRDRLAPPRYARLAPAPAFAALFAHDAAGAWRGARLTPLAHPVAPSELAPTLAAATGLAHGHWTLFGAPVRIEDPPRWNRNPASGAEWPEQASRALDFHRTDLAGGAKYAWELGRLTVLPTLALAWRATGDDAHAARALRWLADFTARNPLGRGIHHTSGIEGAVRVATVTWTLAVLGDRARAGELAPVLGLLAQQALACRDHLSLGSSANNHLLAEYGAMTLAGAVWPSLRGADHLLAVGHRGLEREILRQFHPDGVNAEQSFGYLPFITELVLLPLVAAEAAGRAASPPVRERLARALEVMRTLRLPDGGLPPVGDADEARILLAAHDARLDLTGGALAAWLGADALAPDTGAYAQLVLGRTPVQARSALDGRHVFPDGGYTVWRDRGVLATLDHGPLGLGRLAAHGHADALALTLFRGLDAIVVDPGTYAYHEDEAARARFRSTPYHATVTFDGRNQSELLGPFLWGRRAEVSGDAGHGVCRWASGELHTRTVDASAERVTILDRVEGAGAEVVFPLAPNAAVTLDGRRAVVRTGRTSAVFAAEGIQHWRVEPGEFSAALGRREPAPRLVARLNGAEARTEIRLGDA